jgi:hypothetical protein
MFKMTRAQKKTIAFMSGAERKVAVAAMKDAAQAWEVGYKKVSEPNHFPDLIRECKERYGQQKKNARRKRSKAK